MPVLVREVLRWLRPAAGEAVVDCTLGYGGHSAEFCRRIGPAGRLIGLDVDGAWLARAGERLRSIGTPLCLHRRSFAELDAVLAAEGLDGADVIFADLGASSMQIDDPSRGIHYAHDGPLDMRMDDRLPQTGADLLAALPKAELSAALRELADEPDHDRIAEWIVRQRGVAAITRTGELTRLVFHAKGTTPKAWAKRADYDTPYPAARTFQALRIMVNDELGNLTRLLELAPGCLRPGGRIGIISFHSGEDRLVKRAFRDGRRDGVYSAVSPTVIRPRPGEMRANPRSSSASFRWAVRAK
ncbi:MAG TPA: 16S rRNA (cytosine(1402)-N(4))-methyltransferase RsmH [Phycisphaerae bacterium]|nr:16S rRNA (cytosine(1402)-N(4))-methyltransferase RsmH [Phycisphaerae bacterium]